MQEIDFVLQSYMFCGIPTINCEIFAIHPKNLEVKQPSANTVCLCGRSWENVQKLSMGGGKNVVLKRVQTKFLIQKSTNLRPEKDLLLNFDHPHHIFSRRAVPPPRLRATSLAPPPPVYAPECMYRVPERMPSRGSLGEDLKQ